MLGDRIKELLVKNNMSQKDLSDKTGLSKGSISYYISGNRIPKQDALMKIANALGTSVDYLSGSKESNSYINGKLYYLQRKLEKLDAESLDKAEAILKTVFDDIFDDEEN